MFLKKGFVFAVLFFMALVVNFQIISAKKITVKQQSIKGNYIKISSRIESSKLIATKGSSLKENASVIMHADNNTPNYIWRVEKAGKYFRLQNINSGLYLAKSSKKNDAGKYKVVQKKLSNDKAMKFIAYKIGKKYTFLCTQKPKKYLSFDGENLVLSKRQLTKGFRYKIKGVANPDSFAKATKYTYPKTLKKGKAFTLSGNVSSTFTIKSLTAYIIDENNKKVIKKTIKPNKYSVDLKLVDDSIKFGTLPVGKYIYRVKITDSTNAHITVIEKNFSVTDSQTDITLNIKPGQGKSLTYNKALIEKIGKQENGDALEKKACASYALAYCNCILHGTTPSPHDYWGSANDNNCYWSKGGYTTITYSNEEEVLKVAYNELLKGRPSIIHVASATSESHWITIVGYQNMTGAKNFVPSDFFAIDPWDGQLIVVSGKYVMNSSHRIAVAQ